MNANELQARPQRLPRHPAKWLGATVAAVAFCAAAPNAIAQNHDSTPSSQTSIGTKISDTTITTKVKATLIGTNGLSSDGIHVKTRRGIVMLTGSVPDEQQRTLAAAATRHIEGVRRVRDQLTIQSP